MWGVRGQDLFKMAAIPLSEVVQRHGQHVRSCQPLQNGLPPCCRSSAARISPGSIEFRSSGRVP
jgi:hypothetical protein